MVEVQAASHALACRTVAYNGLAERVTLHRQDLRSWPGGNFDLVTASPPYIPVGHGVQPQHPQKVTARFELHGDIFDYCQAAARSLAAQGLFCFCHAADDARPEHAIRQAGLTLVRRQEVYFRASLPPRLGLFTCAWEGLRADPPALVIRDLAGRWTAEYLALRAEMGAPADISGAGPTPAVTRRSGGVAHTNVPTAAKETNLALIPVWVYGNIGAACPLSAVLRAGRDTPAPLAQAMTLS